MIVAAPVEEVALALGVKTRCLAAKGLSTTLCRRQLAEVSLKIAFIAHHVNFEAGPATVTAHLVEMLCEDHQVSVFSNTINGIDLLKVKHYKVPGLRCAKSLAHMCQVFGTHYLLDIQYLTPCRSFPPQKNRL